MRCAFARFSNHNLSELCGKNRRGISYKVILMLTGAFFITIEGEREWEKQWKKERKCQRKRKRLFLKHDIKLRHRNIMIQYQCDKDFI